MEAFFLQRIEIVVGWFFSRLKGRPLWGKCILKQRPFCKKVSAESVAKWVISEKWNWKFATFWRKKEKKQGLPSTRERRANVRLHSLSNSLQSISFLINGPIPASFFFIFVFSVQLIVKSWLKFCRWLDSNSGPLVLEATALPTEPQPLPKYFLLRITN